MPQSIINPFSPKKRYNDNLFKNVDVDNDKSFDNLEGNEDEEKTNKK